MSRLAFRFFLDRSVGLGQQKDRQQDAENADAQPHGQHLVVESMDALCAPMKRLPSWNSSDAAVDTQQ